MIRLFDIFFPSNVFAGITDRTINFERPSQGILSDPQRKFLSELNIDLSKMTHLRQVHGKRIVFADGALKKDTFEAADGLVTRDRGIPLMIRVADCLPVFLYDSRTHAMGLVHAGWRGTKERIVLEALKVLQERCQSQLKDIQVGFGPAIQSCCYEVGQEFQDNFPAETIRRDSSFFFDLPQANKSQFLETGVLESQIFDSKICTCCDNRFFSYRREGKAAGRMLALMKMS